MRGSRGTMGVRVLRDGRGGWRRVWRAWGASHLVLESEVDARVVEHGDVVSALEVAELKGAARIVHRAGQRLLRRVGLLRIWDVPAHSMHGGGSAHPRPDGLRARRVRACACACRDGVRSCVCVCAHPFVPSFTTA